MQRIYLASFAVFRCLSKINKSSLVQNAHEGRTFVTVVNGKKSEKEHEEGLGQGCMMTKKERKEKGNMKNRKEPK